MAPARYPALALAAVCLICAAWLLSAHRDEKRLQQANALGIRGDLHGAIATAREVRGGPALTQAHAVVAYAELALHRPTAGARELRLALRGRPNDWLLRRDLGVVLLRLGHRKEAQDEMTRALALNPRLRLPPGFLLR